MTLEEKLLESLKTRIKNDVPADQFSDGNWGSVRLGLYYPGDPLVQYMRITTTLKSVFSAILDEDQMTMTQNQWNIYFFGISVNSTANTATSRLLTIAGNEDFI